MISNHGYNNPVYNAHKNVGAHYTWQNTVFSTCGRECKIIVFHQDLLNPRDVRPEDRKLSVSPEKKQTCA